MLAENTLIRDDEEEEETWEEADRLLEEMRTLKATLLQAEASMSSHEEASDVQKGKLLSGFMTNVAGIVESVTSGSIDAAVDAAAEESVDGDPPNEKAPATATNASVEGDHKLQPVNTKSERQPSHRPGLSSQPQRSSNASRKGVRPNAHANAPAASILSEVSRLASKPLLPPAPNASSTPSRNVRSTAR